jgi:hypothetical protein
MRRLRDFQREIRTLKMEEEDILLALAQGNDTQEVAKPRQKPSSKPKKTGKKAVSKRRFVFLLHRLTWKQSK